MKIFRTLLVGVVAVSVLLTEGIHGFRLSIYRYDPTLLSLAGNTRKLSAISSEARQRKKRPLELFPSRQRHANHVTTPATLSWIQPVKSSIRVRGGATVLLTASTNPAMWLGPALACALAYALYNIFIKKASATMDPILGGVLLQLVAATLGAALLAVTKATSSGAKLTTSRMGIMWAMGAGAAVGAAEILSFIISSMGVPASKSIPTVVGGSVVLGTLLGSVWLGEHMSPRGWLGIVLIAGGIALVGMDPGSSLH
jgi:bacterial/archaeal transporter family protein